MKNSIQMGSGAMIYLPSFINIDSDTDRMEIT
jgi:hypothetical protein